MAKLSKYELGWLSGLIDGEGCLYARFISNRSSIEIRLDVQAVSKSMIDEVERLYSSLGIKYNRQPPTIFRLSKRPAERIIVRKKKSLLCLLNIVSPFLIVKQRESRRVIRYLEKATKTKMYFSDADDLTLVSDLKTFKSIA